MNYFLALVSTVGSLSTQAAENRWSPYPILKPLTFRVLGHCESRINGGVLRIRTTGFTPGGTFSWRITRPDGKLYTNNLHGSTDTVNPDGTAPLDMTCGLGLNGQPEDPGEYKIIMFDDVTDLKHLRNDRSIEGKLLIDPLPDPAPLPSSGTPGNVNFPPVHPAPNPNNK